MSAPQPFWADLPEIDEPDTDYLGELAAKHDRIVAQLHDCRGMLTVIDNESGDAWIISARNDFDVTEEVGE